VQVKDMMHAVVIELNWITKERGRRLKVEDGNCSLRRELFRYRFGGGQIGEWP
jgi:hypothetical protein